MITIATILEVAQKAGVSRTTVSRFLNGTGYVSEEAKASIEQAVRQLNYRPNRIAQTLNTGASGNIALIVSDIGNPITARYAKGVEKVTFENHYNLILANTGFDPDKELRTVRMLLDKQVDGIIIAPCCQVRDHLEEAVAGGVPVVFITRKIPGIAADYVRFDNEEGSYKVVRHLLQLGHRDIGVICRDVDVTENSDRLTGYRQALEEYGIRYDERLIVSGVAVEEVGYEAMARLMAANTPPTAIYTAVNLFAAGVIRYCKDNKIAIPGQVALASFESFVELDRIITPQLTANQMPVFELGSTAAELLLARIGANGQAEPYRQISLTGELLVRESTVGSQ